MANYTSVGRTNYFHVRNRAAVDDLLADSGIEIVSDTGRGGIALLDSEGTDWVVRSDDDDDDGIFLPDVIAEHLAPGEVVVFQCIGSERLRYLTGQSVAVNDKGEKVVVDISDIYARAAEVFGVDPSSITAAEL